METGRRNLHQHDLFLEQMKRTFLIILWALVAMWPVLLVGQGVRPALVGASAIRPAAGGGGAAFSDDFNRADSTSLGANWTEQTSDIEIFSNTFRIVSGSFVNTVAIFNTATTTVNQYAQFSVTADGVSIRAPLSRAGRLRPCQPAEPQTIAKVFPRTGRAFRHGRIFSCQRTWERMRQA